MSDLLRERRQVNLSLDSDEVEFVEHYRATCVARGMSKPPTPQKVLKLALRLLIEKSGWGTAVKALEPPQTATTNKNGED